MSKNKKIARVILIIVMAPMLYFAGIWAKDSFELASKRRQLKTDYSNLNSIRYGLLSVDRWRDNIAELVATQIDQFKLNGNQEEKLRESLNNILNALITQANEMMLEKKDSLGGKIRKFAYKTFVDIDKIRAKVPEFSQTILDEIKDPKNKRKLKFIANDKLEEMAQQTKDNLLEESEYQKIMDRYHARSLEEANRTIETQTIRYQRDLYVRAFQIMGIVFLFFGIWFLIRKHRGFYEVVFVFSVLVSLIVLFVGLGTPMIEIDARIKELNFTLLNRNIEFHDQVIFYQSKSILDVVRILINTHKPDSVFVGLLILMFSVLFPVAKLISTEIYLLGKEKWRSNSIISFFAFKSGKWSMADVMVVAIFMAYVGFNGILDNQLEILNVKSTGFQSIATNNTSLQPGFILFITFVLFSLVLSEILKRITAKYVRKPTV